MDLQSLLLSEAPLSCSWEFLLGGLRADHPYHNLGADYPDEARRALLFWEVGEKRYCQDVRQHIQRETGILPTADICLLPDDLWRVWARPYGDPLALYRADTVWVRSLQDHLIAHELLHSVQRTTSGSLPRDTDPDVVLLGEALTEAWVVCFWGENNIYKEERRWLGSIPAELAVWQGEELLRRLPRGAFSSWKKAKAKALGGKKRLVSR